jgi:formylglycine-generating enzyme required for sulfatase activity
VSPGGHDGLSRRPELAKTMALTPFTGDLDETVVDGLEPIRPKSRRGVVEAQAGRRQHMRRVGPLLAVVAVGVAGLAVAAFGVLAGSGPEESGAGFQEDERVALRAGVYTVGLTEDNKESVLAACFVLSDNPNHECRRSYLEELGEYPARQREFPALQYDRYEVTNGRYEQCVAAGGCAARQLDACQFHTHRGYQLNAQVPARMLAAGLPAVCVTREEAEGFCAWAGGRLPSPDEWERAARGGDDRLSPWGDVWAPSLMNWAETDMGGFAVVGRLDGYDLTAPVERFADGATPEGVYNTYGNVAEWVAAAEDRPDGTRGGAYTDDLREYRITYQRPLRPTARRSDVGFRCVRP